MRTPLLAIALLTVQAATGQVTGGQKLERFQLFNRCRPMGLFVGELTDDAAAIGLTKKALQAAAESRLRAARLYTDQFSVSGNSALNVRVTVTGSAFSISVAYFKLVKDTFEESGFAPTWLSSSTGSHRRDASYIESGLSGQLDQFLVAYLRVNEKFCGDPAPQK